MFKTAIIGLAIVAAAGAQAQERAARSGEAGRAAEGRTSGERVERAKEAMRPESKQKSAAEARAEIERIRSEALGRQDKNSEGKAVSEALLGGKTESSVSALDRAKASQAAAKISEKFGVKVDEVAMLTIVRQTPQIAEKLIQASDAMNKALSDCGSACLLPSDARVQRAINAMVKFEAGVARTSNKVFNEVDPQNLAQIITEVARLKEGPNGQKVASTAIEVWAEAYENGFKHVAEGKPGDAFEKGLAEAFKLRGVVNAEERARKGRGCGGKG